MTKTFHTPDDPSQSYPVISHPHWQPPHKTAKKIFSSKNVNLPEKTERVRQLLLFFYTYSSENSWILKFYKHNQEHLNFFSSIIYLSFAKQFSFTSAFNVIVLWFSGSPALLYWFCIAALPCSVFFYLWLCTLWLC